jgi:hypothetical protein
VLQVVQEVQEDRVDPANIHLLYLWESLLLLQGSLLHRESLLLLLPD